MKFFIKKLIPYITIFMAVFMFISLFLNNSDKKNVVNSYQLKAYKNTVALYNGEEIIKIYNNIVLNTLPPKDISNFKSGIPVRSPEQADYYLIDFES